MALVRLARLLSGGRRPTTTWASARVTPLSRQRQAPADVESRPPPAHDARADAERRLQQLKQIDADFANLELDDDDFALDESDLHEADDTSADRGGSRRPRMQSRPSYLDEDVFEGLRPRSRYQSRNHRYMERNAIEAPNGNIVVPHDALAGKSRSRPHPISGALRRKRVGVAVGQAINDALVERGRFDIDVIGVDMSNDLRRAHVFWTSDEATSGANDDLDRIRGPLRAAVARACPMKYVPQLLFKFETGLRAELLRQQFDR